MLRQRGEGGTYLSKKMISLKSTAQRFAMAVKWPVLLPLWISCSTRQKQLLSPRARTSAYGYTAYGFGRRHRGCLYTCQCICIFTRPYTCLQTCVYTCPYTCLQLCPHTCPHTHVDKCVHTRGYASQHTCHVYTHVRTHVSIHMSIHVRIRAHTT